MTYFQKGQPSNEASNLHVWVIQNKLRNMVILAAIGTVNWALVRRVVLPQLGILVSGTWRNLCVDYVPGLLYLNFQFNIGLVKYSKPINYLDPYNNESNDWLTDLQKQYTEQATERKVNRQFYSDSQYWH